MTSTETSTDSAKRPGLSSKGRRQIVAVTIFLVVALVFTVTFRMAVVKGQSMEPTYRDGDILLVNKLYRITGPLRKGDVVLVRMNNEVLVKRLAYMPGEPIEGRDMFRFRRVAEFFDVERENPPRSSPAGMRLRVPPGYVVVLGDNRARSDDSRSFGPVALRDVLGRVVNAPK